MKRPKVITQSAFILQFIRQHDNIDNMSHYIDELIYNLSRMFALRHFLSREFSIPFFTKCVIKYILRH